MQKRNAKTRSTFKRNLNGASRHQRRRRQELIIRIGTMVLLLGVIFLVVFFAVLLFMQIPGRGSEKRSKVIEEAPEFDVQLLTVNPYSRPGTATDKIRGLVIHYTANPGTTAQNNHDYFEGLKQSHITSASSHFIVGLDGEIIQCIPTKEVAYASNSRNKDTVSIELCYTDESGKFSDSTYDSAVHLTAWLCGKFGLTTEDVIRHYDIKGKNCPKYFVEHKDAWKDFKTDVQKYINKNGVTAKENDS